MSFLGGRVVAVAVASMSMALAAGTAQAAPWSAPTDLGPGDNAISSPTLAVAPDGNGLASWDVHTNVPIGPTPAGYVGDAGRVARLTQGDGFGELRSLPDAVVAGPVLDAGGRGLVLRSTALYGDGTTRAPLTWSNVNAAGAVGAARKLGSSVVGTTPGLATDARGDALVGWSELTRSRKHDVLTSTLTVKAAWRPAGASRFQAPRTLFTTQDILSDHPGSVEVAVNAAGRGLVVYADGHQTRHGLKRTIYAWPARVGRAFGARLAAGSHEGIVQATAVMDPRGRATVVWGTQDGGEEAGQPWIVHSASLAPGAKAFDAVHVLDAGGGGAAASRPMGAIAVATDATGHVTVAWSGVRRAPSVPQGFGFPVDVATSDGAGHWGAVQELAPLGAVGGVAVRADGAAIVTWARVVQYQETDQAQAAIRPAGAPAFGAAEALADPDHAGPPAVAFDPQTGAPIAIWSARPNGQDPALGAGSTAVLRVATRGAP